jgi:hypothetical protein
VHLGCVPWARQGNTKKVRTLVNGGSNGLAEVEIWARKWEEALPGVTPAPLAPRGSDTGAAPTITLVEHHPRRRRHACVARDR